MNVEIRTEAPIFLFWEYLFQIFGILSLQCGLCKDTYRGSACTMHNNLIINNVHKCTFIISIDENPETRAILISPETSCLVMVFGSHISVIHMLVCTYIQ
jgi:hypothetical protein